MSPPDSSTPMDDQENISTMENTRIHLPQNTQDITQEDMADIENWLRFRDQNNRDPTHSNSHSPPRIDTQSSNQGMSVSSAASDCNENSIPIDAKLYQFLVNGKKDGILASEDNLEKYKSKKERNTVLHIAAGAGQAEFITDILPKCQGVISWKNIKGDLALHSAARAGHANVLKAFINYQGFSKDLFGSENNEGNSVLHIALQNNREGMAEDLMKEYPKACYRLNLDGVSPLYLAIKLGYWQLVKLMVSYTVQHKLEAQSALLEGKSVVHAAIESNNLETLKEILSNHKYLIKSLDKEGRQTPLSYAAFRGNLEMVKYILEDFPESAYECDEDKEGSFPIHKAASGGNIKIIKELHYTKQFLNLKLRNILHAAAASGRSKVVSYLLKMEDLKDLINQKDEDGNTPLHLATKRSHPRVVYILTREKRCKIELENKDGLTALDVAELDCGSSPSFEARLTWMALRYVNAPRSSLSTRKNYMRKKKKEMQQKQNKKVNEINNLESYMDRINTLLVVATLVATVTFAAGFTVPGGYVQSDPHIGMAVLAKRCAFKVFVLCNTAAMYCSILSVVSLIWAHMGDLKLVLVSLKFALPLLILSLTMMSLAFMMGLFVVLKTVTWLSYVVLGMGSLFLLILLVISIPLYNPSKITNSVKRFFFSRVFLLLLLVCEKSAVKYA